MKIPGETYLFNRQYSLSVAPGQEYFRISVKKEAEGETHEGKVSNYLHTSIQIGDTIEITAPAGEFTLDKKETPVVFLAGGVGITPLLSMVKLYQQSSLIVLYNSFKRQIMELSKLSKMNWLPSI